MPGNNPGVLFAGTERGAHGREFIQVMAQHWVSSLTPPSNAKCLMKNRSLGWKSTQHALVPKQETPPVQETLWQCRWEPPLRRTDGQKGSQSVPLSKAFGSEPISSHLTEETCKQDLLQPLHTTLWKEGPPRKGACSSRSRPCRGYETDSGP